MFNFVYIRRRIMFKANVKVISFIVKMVFNLVFWSEINKL